MRKIFLAAAVAAIVASCAPKTQVSGKLDGTDALSFSYVSELGTALEVAGEIDMKDGKFAFDIADEYGDLIIYDEDDFVHVIRLVLVPDEKIVLSGLYQDYTLSGSPFYQDMGEFHELTKHLDARLDEALEARIKAEEEGREYVNNYRELKAEADLEKGDIALDFIKTHPDSDFSAYLVSTLRVALFDRGESLLTERARNGKMAFLINKKHVAIHGAEIAKQAREYIKVGAEAPDFTLKTLEGTDLTLSSLRGRYVMLDFWGTWCHWCVEGMPKVKAVSETYADKLTVISVDCHDSEIEWKKGLDEIKIMTWTQVYNPADFALDAQYAVDGFPTFVVIDPEGKIAKIIVGEGSDLVAEVGECIE